MTVYVLSLGGKLGSEKHTAQFYIGYCEPGRLLTRLAEHRAGRGAAITRAAVQRGFALKLVASIDGDRALERKLKNLKNSRKAIAWIHRQQRELCPVCEVWEIHRDDGLCPVCMDNIDRIA